MDRSILHHVAARRSVLVGGAAAAALWLQPARAFAMTGLQGWYADPELHVFDGGWWLYATTSEAPAAAPPPVLTTTQMRMRQGPKVRPAYLGQTYMDAFSSPDLVTWTRHPRVLDVSNVPWAAYALWAPSVIQMGRRYAMLFGANDIQSDAATGGIGLVWADAPQGPFRDTLGAPLVGAFHNGAQPIDPFVFRDDDDQIYLFYGGWGRCNVARLSPDLSRSQPFADGSTFMAITPPGYVEGSFLIKRQGVYYLMWSEGEWTGPDYRVAYARGSSPVGPFTGGGVILRQDPRIARGAGHHSVTQVPGRDQWIIAYHRRPLGETQGDHRVLAVDRLRFDREGKILPVIMTEAGPGQTRP